MIDIKRIGHDAYLVVKYPFGDPEDTEAAVFEYLDELSLIQYLLDSGISSEELNDHLTTLEEDEIVEVMISKTNL